MVGASKGITTAIGDLLSDIIESLAKLKPESMEAQSTEELLRGIEEAKKGLGEVVAHEVVLASIDVMALYLSIDQVASAR